MPTRSSIVGSTIKFVVIAQARSGSTLLRKALHSNPEVVCHGEVLSRKWINGLVPKNNHSEERSSRHIVEKLLPNRNDNPSEFLDHYIYDFPEKATGFKLIYEDFFLADWKNELQNYIERNNIIVFHLVRLNQLAAFVSRKRMALYNVSHSNDPVEKHPRIEVRPDEIERYFTQQSLFRNRIDSLFPSTQPIFYEHIEAGYNVVLESLDIKWLPMQYKLAKLNSISLEESILNYSEIKHYDLTGV